MDVTEPVVRTAAGLVRGRAKGGVAVFRGIPFAQPPVGDLRFAAPRPARAWDGVREAATFGPPPPQSGFLLTPMPPTAPDADPDDWLTVNVFSPDLGAAGLPVMVWIYGGAYRFGASSLLGYDGTPLARQNVVVVTFNHRIGVEGYAYLPGVPANRALLDQVAALRWVRENIAAFGGHPDLVTVFGESAGAGAIASLLVMPAAAGLFRRAIAQSVPGTFFSPALAAEVTAAIAQEAGLPATTEAFAAADPARLAAASDAVRPSDHPGGRSLGTGVPFSPVVDGEVLPVPPWRARRGRRRLRTSTCSPGTTATSTGCSPSCPGCAGRSPTRRPARRCAGWPGADGEAAYREAYPDADAETLFELVNSDWLFRMPTLHLAQAHAAAGGRTFLYQVSYPASEARSRRLPRDRRAAGLRRLLRARPDAVRPRAAGQRGGARGPDALAVGGVRRGRRPRLAAVRAGPPDDPHLRRPAGRGPVPGRASLHIWDQHRFGVLDLSPSPA